MVKKIEKKIVGYSVLNDKDDAPKAEVVQIGEPLERPEHIRGKPLIRLQRQSLSTRFI